MSCDHCSTAQALRGPEIGQHFYVRVGNANVEIVGCHDHVLAVVAIIREYHKIMDAASDWVGWEEGHLHDVDDSSSEHLQQHRDSSADPGSVPPLSDA